MTDAKEYKLQIELVPATSWYSNVRSEVSKDEWDIIRRKCYQLADYKCELCGGKGKKWPVECHELWEYNDKKNTQKLVRLIALCPDCHQVKHIGLAGIKGKSEEAKEHLMEVNGMSSEEADNLIEEAFDKWRERSNYEWEVDTKYLDQYFPQPNNII